MKAQQLQNMIDKIVKVFEPYQRYSYEYLVENVTVSKKQLSLFHIALIELELSGRITQVGEEIYRLNQ